MIPVLFWVVGTIVIIQLIIKSVGRNSILQGVMTLNGSGLSPGVTSPGATARGPGISVGGGSPEAAVVRTASVKVRVTLGLAWPGRQVQVSPSIRIRRSRSPTALAESCRPRGRGPAAALPRLALACECCSHVWSVALQSAGSFSRCFSADVQYGTLTKKCMQEFACHSTVLILLRW